MTERTTPIQQRIRNLGLAAVAGQAGCATLIIVFSALFFGLWLDSRFDQNGVCTFGMVILSVPLSLYVMLRIALGAINRIEFSANKKQLDSSETKEV